MNKRDVEGDKTNRSLLTHPKGGYARQLERAARRQRHNAIGAVRSRAAQRHGSLVHFNHTF